MYIAIKWLFILAVAMWITLCCIDAFLERNKDIRSTGPNDEPTILIYKNETVMKEKPEVRTENSNIHDVGRGVAVFNYLTFFAGALVVSAFNRKKEIISFAKSKIAKINIRAVITFIRSQIDRNVTIINNSRVTIVKYSKKVWEIVKKATKKVIARLQIIPYVLRLKQAQNRQNLNILLLKKMKEVGEQRNNLGHLLVAAIKENKSIRLQFHLETMAKNRLLRTIEVTNKQMKENRSRYVSFQQLYLVVHQENIFLKARLRKLRKDKEEAVSDLMNLLNEVYHSKNKELKAYCSRFIVRSKHNLLNSDVNEEIRKFLQKSHMPTASTSNWQLHDESNIEINTRNSWPSTRVTDTLPNKSLVPIVTDEPKLRGLPGEYVWTVKDKDGMIEKLYEYDLGYNFDNGETIRRIREYSVYHDKDCLLDFANSRTLLQETSVDTGSLNECPSLEFSSNQSTKSVSNFLTGSEAFRKFLQNNDNNIVTPRKPLPPLQCG